MKINEYKFIVFLSPTNYITITANKVDDGSNHLYFQRIVDNGNGTYNYENISSFPFENIVGWALAEHVTGSGQ